MMAAWLLILLAFFPSQITIPLKKKQAEPPPNHLGWKSLDNSYLSLAVVKPVLVNNSNRVISLECNDRYGCGRLLRQDELTQKWDVGDCPRKCHDYVKPHRTVKIDAGQEYQLELYWKDYVDPCTGPRFFVVNKKMRPLPGKYKIEVTYSYIDQWKLQQIVPVQSKVFEIEY
jgi:hypothetical protein